MKLSDDELDQVEDAFVGFHGTTRQSLKHAISMLPDREQVIMPPDADAEAERAGRFATQVADEVCSTLSRANLLTDEDLRLIREHVRPKDAGDAVEAAVLAERIRCARVAQHLGANGSILDAILSGREPGQ